MRQLSTKNADRTMVGMEDLFAGTNLQEPCSVVWLIDGGSVQILDEPEFRTGDCYVCLTATPLEIKGARSRTNQLEVHVHFWLGNEASTDKKALAAIRSVQLASAAQPRVSAQHREEQGEESERFLEAFAGAGGEMEVLSGGGDSYLNHVEPTPPKTALYQFKGVKNVRISLVETSPNSLNSGDAFLLDTGGSMYVWFGKSSNWQERTLAAQASAHMRTAYKRPPHSPVYTLYEGEEGKETERFWQAIGGRPESGRVCSAEEGGDDKAFESEVEYDLYEIDLKEDMKVEMRYLEQGADGSLFMSRMRSDCAYVLDTKSEMYVCIGPSAAPIQREVALKLAVDSVTGANKDEEEDADEVPRPNFCSVRTMIHPYLHPMFTLKFVDWFLYTERPVSYVTVPKRSTEKPTVRVGVALDQLLTEAQPNRPPPQRIYIEKDAKSGVDLAVYEVDGHTLSKVDEPNYGIFGSDKCYVVLCAFVFKRSRRYVLFFWEGIRAGKAAYFVWSYDLLPALVEKMAAVGYSSKPAVCRVFQGREPDEFLSFFNTGIIVLLPEPAAAERGRLAADSARRSDGIDRSRLFHIRGATEASTRTREVACRPESLNSTDAFVLRESGQDGVYFIWYGALCSEEEEARAARAAVRMYTTLLERGKNTDTDGDAPDESKVDVERVFQTIREGKEPPEFWLALGGRGDYARLQALPDPAANAIMLNPRLHRFRTRGNTLVAEQLFDFAQSDLQPNGVYLLDMWKYVFVWVGRDAASRCAEAAGRVAGAMVREQERKAVVVKAIKEGSEPLEFTHAFPGWHSTTRFVDPYAPRLAKLVDQGVVGRPISKEAALEALRGCTKPLPRSLRELKEKKQEGADAKVPPKGRKIKKKPPPTPRTGKKPPPLARRRRRDNQRVSEEMVGKISAEKKGSGTPPPPPLPAKDTEMPELNRQDSEVLPPPPPAPPVDD